MNNENIYRCILASVALFCAFKIYNTEGEAIHPVPQKVLQSVVEESNSPAVVSPQITPAITHGIITQQVQLKRLEMRERYAHGRLIATYESDLENRVQIYEVPGKYPLIRVEGEVAMVADHVLVKLQNGKTVEDLQLVLDAIGATVLKEMGSGFYLVHFDGKDPRVFNEVMKQLTEQKSIVARAEPDLVVSL